MPKIVDKMKIGNPSLDKRVKLLPEQKEEIKKSELSNGALAKIYNVSRRTIQFIKNPDALEENKKRRKERGGWKQYYKKKIHKQAIKEHRDYKDELLSKNLLK